MRTCAAVASLHRRFISTLSIDIVQGGRYALKQRRLAYFARGSITVRLTSSLTGLDSTIPLNLLIVTYCS